jgi:hypothetical protein
MDQENVVQEKRKVQVGFSSEEEFTDFRNSIKDNEKIFNLLGLLNENPKSSNQIIQEAKQKGKAGRVTFWKIFKEIKNNRERFEKELGIKVTEKSRFETPSGHPRLELSRSSVVNIILHSQLCDYVIAFDKSSIPGNLKE